ncbi:MAG: transporter, transrane protein [Chitinophagaceae bacterium]|nr:transporter, transrane protein [Chitinophagaceae bacterium]
MFFIIASNYFAVLAPQVTGYVVNKVQLVLSGGTISSQDKEHDALVNLFINWSEERFEGTSFIALACITILILALLSGLFMFFMRQTLIVMSRHIEYDQKNEIFKHYQELDTNFYRMHNTGDLMNRISEDVSRVRMYTGPAVMYLANLAVRISLCTFFMAKKDWLLTIYVLAPLPILAVIIYYVNTIIHRRSEKIQGLLSDLTTNAQQSYSGIRVIKSYVQEKAMLGFFDRNSEAYKRNAIGLAKVESVYFPSMALMIGLSTLITVGIGSWQALNDPATKAGLIVEFVIYINMLTFPVSAIGWVASMIQRAAASQKRINEFLHTVPTVKDEHTDQKAKLTGTIHLRDVNFVYPHTGIHAVHDFSLEIRQGEKVLILGRTGSGKSTIAQLLLRFYDTTSGEIAINGQPINTVSLKQLRERISYVPQDVFLFSDTISDNIAFGITASTRVVSPETAATYAVIDREIRTFHNGYDTMIGERGVTLSGGQKQRISIARALMKDSDIIILDDCLSAVDAKTEHEITKNLNQYLGDKTAIIITHRIISSIEFDQVIVMSHGKILEQGKHESLLEKRGYYAELYRMQMAGLSDEELSKI